MFPEEAVPGCIERYVPSGRVAWGRFVALFPLVPLGALASAFLLYLIHSVFYVYAITPLLASLPATLVVGFVIDRGHCRNRLLARALGTALPLLVYAGFWMVEYELDVRRQGPAAVAHVERVGGAPGAIGYFFYRCEMDETVQVPNIFQERGQKGGAYFFDVLTMSAWSLVTGAMAASFARRAYDEGTRTWAPFVHLFFRPADLGSVMRAIEARDWPDLARFPRSFSPGGSFGSITPAWLRLRIERAKREGRLAFFVTLSGMHLGTVPQARRLAGFFGGIWKTVVRQAAVEGASAEELDRAFMLSRLFAAKERAC